MQLAQRIGVDEAHRLVQAGEALLVCAYDDEEKFRALHLEGAISRTQLRQREAQLPPDQRIIFYCA